MALEPTMRQFAEQVIRVFREYGDAHGWPHNSYQLFLRINEEWNTAHIILVSERLEEGEARDQWKEIMKFIDQHLNGLLKYFTSFNLTLRTPSQINEGGIYEFGPEFVPVEDILATRPMA